ncbi:MAG: hypothetical protein HFH41_00025 [Lachnospiraceae bacterium]|nr:hypothetical protein [Lachnospiraceae bacterium]
MKKKLAGMITVGMLCICMAAGCTGNSAGDRPAGGKAETEKKEDKTAETEDKEETEDSEKKTGGYLFKSGQIEIAVDQNMAEIADQLGEPDSYYEEPSCAAQGIAKIYTYPGFEIETYPDGDKDLIACVVLKDDSVATPEGVDLSMTKEDILKIYGSEYEESGKGMVYEKDGTKLCFIMEGDDIASIEYNSPVLN